MPRKGQKSPIAELELTLPSSGLKVIAELWSIQPADPDVGIFNAGPDDYTVKSAFIPGMDIELDLTDDDFVVEKLCHLIQDMQYDE